MHLSGLVLRQGACAVGYRADHALIEAADRNMYAAKSQGIGRVC
jgi:GGDEF domain-containing protein